MLRHLLLILFFSAHAWGDVRPSFRLLTFEADDPWSAMQTIYTPEPDGTYKTQTLGGIMGADSEDCEDLLRGYQRPALEAMRRRGYITREVYEELSDTGNRAHNMRQYILASAYIDVPQAEAGAKYALDRIMDQPDDIQLRRVHMGSLFAVRGYDFDRDGTRPRPLPWEIALLPSSLKKPLDRTRIPFAIELGRAHSEADAPVDTFSRLIHFLTNSLASDLKILGVDPKTVPVMGHVYRPSVAAHFSPMIAGAPMTPEMQSNLESDPVGFLAATPTLPKDWRAFQDAILISSLDRMIQKYPIDATSAMATDLSRLLPFALPAFERQNIIQELAAALREDYTLMGTTVQLRDFGSGLLKIKFTNILARHHVNFNPSLLHALWQLLSKYNLQMDPDAGFAGLHDNAIYIPIPKDQVMKQKGEMIPALVVSNIPANAGEEFLAKLVLATASLIKTKLSALTPEQSDFLLRDMNEIRRLKKIDPVAAVTLRSFMATYAVHFAAKDLHARNNLSLLGGEKRESIRFETVSKFGERNVEFKIELNELGLSTADAQDPIKFQAAMQAYANKLMQKHILDRFQSATIYRFTIDDVNALIEIWAPDRKVVGFTDREFHRRRIARLYITYQ